MGRGGNAILVKTPVSALSRDEPTRFRDDYKLVDPIDVDPGFNSEGKLKASAGCDYNMTHTQQHWGWFTPQQIRRGDMPCETCNTTRNKGES